MKNKYVKSVAIIVFIFIIAGVIIFEIFKENNNLENISEETRIEIMKIVGIEESKSFKPIYLKSYIGDFRDNSTNGYELKYEISKEDFEKNNLHYEKESIYDAQLDASKCVEKDSNTYICYIKRTPLYNKEICDKFENILKEIQCYD